MAVENALAFLRGGGRAAPPVFLIAGPQPFLREYVLDTVRLHLASAGFQYRPFQVGGADGYGGAISELEGADLFAPKRLIACRVLKTHRERASAADDDDGDGVEGKSGGAADESALGAALERISGPVHVALVYERDNAPAKIRRVVEKIGTVINCLRPYDNQIGQYVEVFAQKLGLKLTSTAIDLLIGRHGSDLAAISNALAKAAISSADGAKIESSDFGAGGPTRIPDLFELAESVARGRPDEALALFDRAIQTGRDPIEVLAVEVIPLVRRMLVAASMLEKRKSPADVARVLGMQPTSQLVVRAVDGGRRFGAQRLMRAHRRACELDAKFKNGLIHERESAISSMLLDLMAPAES
ncbi:MAG: DNA polymerase III subunit delta [Candidatus Binataceae bacterium]|jgi:DNA polymerase III delta subunit